MKKQNSNQNVKVGKMVVLVKDFDHNHKFQLFQLSCKIVKDSQTDFFFNWDSLHARLNGHYEAWSYKKRSIKKITGYRKCV